VLKSVTHVSTMSAHHAALTPLVKRQEFDLYVYIYIYIYIYM
jgi:hypothetical protein